VLVVCTDGICGTPQALYNVKYEGRSTLPWALTRDQVRAYLAAFSEELHGGPWQISVDNFQRYLVETRQVQHKKAFALYAIEQRASSREEPLPRLFAAWLALPLSEQEAYVSRVCGQPELPDAKGEEAPERLHRIAQPSHSKKALYEQGMSQEDNAIADFLRKVNDYGLGLADLSAMTKRCIEEEVDELYQRLYPKTQAPLSSLHTDGPSAAPKNRAWGGAKGGGDAEAGPPPANFDAEL